MNSHNNSRKTSTPVLKSTRLLDQLREQIRYLHYSLRTEEAYVYWVKKFIYFHHKRHPRSLVLDFIALSQTLLPLNKRNVLIPASLYSH
jgi:Phage integrase, N-terminal SAM-like domain